MGPPLSSTIYFFSSCNPALPPFPLWPFTFSFLPLLLIKRKPASESHTHKPGLDQTQPGEQDFIAIMSEVSQLPPLPLWSTVPNFNASSAPFAPVTPALPQEETAMQAHTIVIIVIFCGVCLLLLLAFLYTFCFHCSIRTPPTDVQMANSCSLDREDATYKCTSSECQSAANIV